MPNPGPTLLKAEIDALTAVVMSHTSNIRINKEPATKVKKYRKKYFIGLAKDMVHNIDETGFKEWTYPGIRAQLLNVHTKELVEDFVVEGDQDSVHVLNAVSPAFTSCFPFALWVIEKFIVKK